MPELNYENLLELGKEYVKERPIAFQSFAHYDFFEWLRQREAAQHKVQPDRDLPSEKEIGLRMARAYPEQIEAMRQWFHELEEILDDDDKDVVDIGKFVQDTFENRRIDEYERILFGYETLVDNACDKSKSYLDWNPEIKEALKTLTTRQGTPPIQNQI